LKILVLDIETTALHSSDGNIVEIGAVFLNTENGKVEKAFHSLILEESEFDENAWIFENSDLTPELVKKEGKKLDEIRQELQELLDKYPTTAYNSQFDFGWLESRDFTIKEQLADPMGIATDILQIRNYYGYKWPSVQECLKYWNINEIEPHRAYDDSRLEAQIVYKLIQLGKFPLPLKCKNCSAVLTANEDYICDKCNDKCQEEGFLEQSDSLNGEYIGY
jgi:DNA polymerase III alpha subunit (gram-positive type)